ncbi:response regulator transcription factor [Cochlodiniinecator piscidefendens]|uniref:response regulator transcription factor n=1 Tax=Cochlodiniinecator piscidefendens TaxID=2715756 RepID=UPI00140784BE|nr:response regulator transcription factor [Cochlodiniinecator piscidefendens]
MTLTVCIADQSALVCQGIAAMLSPMENVDVVGTATSLGALVTTMVNAPEDTILVTGLRLVDGDITHFLPNLRRQGFTPITIALANANEATLAKLAVREGATGICLIDHVQDQLPQMLHSVARGVSCLPTTLLERIVRDNANPLTKREHEILECLAQGLTNFQLSTRLGISENTIKYNLKVIYQKLEVNSRGAAISKFFSGGF